jgi:hypothetical protein
VVFFFGDLMHIMIAIPSYTGVIHMATMRSLMGDIVELIKRGDRFTLVDDIGNAMIADSRGIIASRFLESDCDCLVFIDNDVTWQKGGLLRIIDAPVDLCAGIYPMRFEPIRYPLHYLDKEELWADPDTGLLEVKSVATGFMKLSRNCIQKMIEAYPDKHYYTAERDKQFYPIFEFICEDGYRWGEDFSFCIRWRKIGGKVWADPEIKMGHIGLKMFEGHLGNYLRNR